MLGAEKKNKKLINTNIIIRHKLLLYPKMSSCGDPVSAYSNKFIFSNKNQSRNKYNLTNIQELSSPKVE